MPKSKELTTELWEKALLPIDATLQQAISNLNETSFQIALIVGAEGVLEGTLTDGDIRRGLLRGMIMDSSVEPIINRDPLVVPSDLDRDSVLQLMQANRIHQLPIVDEQRSVVGLHLLDELMEPRQIPNLMVIMAGGQGTRLKPFTENCPKPMLRVDGKPMLAHIVERAKAEGFQNFILAVHYLGNMIEEYFGDGSQWNIKIDYLREESPLGTAGAISLLSPRPKVPFIVSNADVLTDIDYGDMLDYHCRHYVSATMAVRIHEWQHPFGIVHTKGVNIMGFEEKPVFRNHINAGVYVLDPNVLDMIKKDEHCDMPTLFNRLQERDKKTIVYPMHEPWLDVGHVDDLKRAQKDHQKNS
jgi:dTDP-glucose pyrophosphorylase/CBS domain-containing protein